jgi:hypothetical protein
MSHIIRCDYCKKNTININPPVNWITTAYKNGPYELSIIYHFCCKEHLIKYYQDGPK